ncbi:hypothetical protein NUW54_g12074 [Trametes sanguinea]|uniref:Uncharacterized protein n=1 Tax=Trametes sanguinea TaxID=158606 RepID=A0ACC1N270_9APHY|nr:hypothetical protein NUW54_g12074 [Trametes sanguinea]
MAPAPKKKALKIGRALKRLPARAIGGRGNGNAFAPLPGEQPIVILRVQVLSCTNLLAKDRNGSSDPFVVVSLLANRHQTPVSKRNVNPTYNPKDATFDFPIYLSLADKLGVVELVVWDKDMLKKDYLGEAAIPLQDWFRDGSAFAFDDVNNKMISRNLVSTRNSTPATGSIQVKLGFVMPANTTSLMDFGEIYSELVKRERPSLVSAPPTEGIGTIRSNQEGPQFEDDGLSSDRGRVLEDDAALRVEAAASFAASRKGSGAGLPALRRLSSAVMVTSGGVMPTRVMQP